MPGENQAQGKSLDPSQVKLPLSEARYPVLSQDDDFRATVLEHMLANMRKSKKMHTIPEYTSTGTIGSAAKSVASVRDLARADTSLATCETIERREIEMLHDTYASSLEWSTISKLIEEGVIDDKQASVRQQTWFDNDIMGRIFHQMTTQMESSFKCLYPLGIESSTLTPLDVVCIADTVITLDSFFSDCGDFVTFPAVPGAKFTAETTPPFIKPIFYSVMAVKAAIANAKINQEDFHEIAIQYFYDRTFAAKLPVQQQTLLWLVESAVSLIFRIPMYEKELLNFYERALEVERRLMHGDCAHDNTITLDYQKGETVGKGSYGTVYRCVNIRNGKFLALKELPLKDCLDTEREIRYEIDTLKSLSNDYIVKYYGCKFDRDNRKVSILMEYAPKSLRDVLTECKGLTLPLISHYSRRILMGLKYLHEKNVIHRDIKAANVLVTDSGDVKLSDFGSAVLYQEAASGDSDTHFEVPDKAPSADAQATTGTRTIHDTITMTIGTHMHEVDVKPSAATATEEDPGDTHLRDNLRRNRAKRAIVGTPLFMAPEVLKGAMPGESSDIWAFGCTLLELITGKHPWQEFVEEKMPIQLVLYRISQATRPPQIPDHIEVNEEFRDFLGRCLAIDPTLRYSAAQLLEHPFITGRSRAGSMMSNDSMWMPSGAMSSSSNSVRSPMTHHGSDMSSMSANSGSTSAMASLRMVKIEANTEESDSSASTSPAQTPQGVSMTPMSQHAGMKNALGMAAMQEGSGNGSNVWPASMGPHGMRHGEVVPPAAKKEMSTTSSDSHMASSVVSTLQTDYTTTIS